jgi:hypothetical protein
MCSARVSFFDFFGLDTQSLPEGDAKARRETLTSMKDRSHALKQLNNWMWKSDKNLLPLNVESIEKTIEPEGITLEGIRIWCHTLHGAKSFEDV